MLELCRGGKGAFPGPISEGSCLSIPHGFVLLQALLSYSETLQNGAEGLGA